jgi:tight adherence protein B
MLVRRRREQEREELAQQFKECILSVAASLKAGYAVENAFLESRSDMEMLYGRGSAIYRELEAIRRGLVINITLEEQLFGLAQRSEIEEIEQFATVFSIAKRSGGNLAEIIKKTADLIGRKMDARQEMRVMLSGKRMEMNIMKLMPFGVLGYIGMGYAGYFDMLYHNWQGVLIMTACLLLYLGAFLLGEKVMQQIEKELL